LRLDKHNICQPLSYLRECKDLGRKPIMERRETETKAQQERKREANLNKQESLPIRFERRAMGDIGTLDACTR
jgi:hypothetical protein